MPNFSEFHWDIDFNAVSCLVSTILTLTLTEWRGPDIGSFRGPGSCGEYLSVDSFVAGPFNTWVETLAPSPDDFVISAMPLTRMGRPRFQWHKAKLWSTQNSAECRSWEDWYTSPAPNNRLCPSVIMITGPTSGEWRWKKNMVLRKRFWKPCLIQHGVPWRHDMGTS